MFGTLQIIVWVLPYFLKDPLERAGAFAFAMSSFLHTVLFYQAGGDIYYVSAMGFDLCAIITITFLRYSDFNFTIALVLIGAMTTNLGGMLCYESGLTPAYYDLSYLIMYSSIIALFLTGGSHGKGVGNPFRKISFRGLPPGPRSNLSVQNVAGENQ